MLNNTTFGFKPIKWVSEKEKKSNECVLGCVYADLSTIWIGCTESKFIWNISFKNLYHRIAAKFMWIANECKDTTYDFSCLRIAHFMFVWLFYPFCPNVITIHLSESFKVQTKNTHFVSNIFGAYFPKSVVYLTKLHERVFFRSHYSGLT